MKVSEKDIQLYLGDCLNVLKNMENDSIDLIVTSPPYNKGYWSSNRNINNGFKTKSRRIEYGDYKDSLAPDEYIFKQKEILRECIRIIKPSGSIFYNHIDILNGHQTIHPLYIYEFPVKQIIIWNRKNTPKLDKSYFFPINEYIFWVQKSKSARVKFRRKNALFNKNIWEINPDKANKFPAPFPIELPMNCILTCTDEGDTVLDPFMGSGTTGVACAKTNRKFIGIELIKEYYETAQARIKIEQESEMIICDEETKAINKKVEKEDD